MGTTIATNLMMDSAGWRDLKERRQTGWSALQQGADDCAQRMKEKLGNCFRETPVPAETLTMLLREFFEEWERRRRGPAHEVHAFTLQQFFKQSRFFKPLVEDASAIGWADAAVLRAKVEQEWRKCFEQLAGKSAGAHTQLVVRDRTQRGEGPPKTVFEAIFSPAEDAGRLFGLDFDPFLEGHGQTEDKGQAQKLFEAMGELFAGHIAIGRTIEARKGFWSAQAALLDEFKFVLSPEPPARRSFWRRIWERITGCRSGQAELERYRKLREQRAWQAPLLEKVPAARPFWMPMHNRRVECVREQKQLDTARVDLDRQMSDINSTLKAHQEHYQRLARLEDPVTVHSEMANASESIAKANKTFVEVQVLYNQINTVL